MIHKGPEKQFTNSLTLLFKIKVYFIIIRHIGIWLWGKAHRRRGGPDEVRAPSDSMPQTPKVVDPPLL